MSDINGDNHRVRRRAVRSVGPPVEGDAAGIEASSTGATVKKAPVHAVAMSKSGNDVAPKPGEAAAADSVEKDVVDAGVVDTATSVDLGKDATKSAQEAVDTSDAGAVAKPKRRAWPIAAAVAAALLAVLTVIGAGTVTYLAHEGNQRDDRRAEYLQTARQAVLNLTTIRADSAKEDIDRILSMASGQFKNEFDGRVDPFMSIVQQAKVVSNGEVVDAAIQTDDEDSAQVLVAAKQTLTNAGQAEPQTRYYRFRVTVTRGDSGLTASKVEFVA
ncbi:hypothetical protein [Nocardia sp. NPDC005366]|uniref:hypothetical protein n=1 Tax=Nocardia sp. NPDC005366 TaxID=3156878 RepID=UPI0033A7283E